jgi:hypothetical protein
MVCGSAAAPVAATAAEAVDAAAAAGDACAGRPCEALSFDAVIRVRLSDHRDMCMFIFRLIKLCAVIRVTAAESEWVLEISNGLFMLACRISPGSHVARSAGGIDCCHPV